MPPWLFLALLVSLLAALGYQILCIRSLRRLPLYWAICLAGFLLGEALADASTLHTPHLGEIQVIPDLLGVAIAVALLRVLRL
jgi:hypothetical protein